MNISVIIPTYNRAILLERALRSVSAQTVPPQEVIVVDDGSGDGTEKVVRASFPQAHYIWQRNQGVSRARNRAIKEARGEWLAFLDSDDEWLPDKLAIQRKMLATNPQYKLCHTNEIWVRNGKRVNPMKKHTKYGGAIFRRCLPLCVISPSSVLIHRSVLARVGMFNESLPACEDYDLWLRVCAIYPVLFVDRPLIIKYGGHEDQLSNRYPAMDRFRIAALESVVHTGTLSASNRQAAFATLLDKIGIYLEGAAKRQKWHEVSQYRQKQAYYLKLAEGLSPDRAMNRSASSTAEAQ